jgi:hypothetical protein
MSACALALAAVDLESMQNHANSWWGTNGSENALGKDRQYRWRSREIRSGKPFGLCEKAP